MMAKAIEQWSALAKHQRHENELFGHGRRCYCCKCRAIGHEAHECKTALQRSQHGSRAGECGPGNIPKGSDPSSTSCMRDASGSEK